MHLIKKNLTNVKILLLIFTIYPSTCFSQYTICKYTGLNCPEIKYENLVVRDNLYFEKFKDYPFTGVSIGQKQGSIVNGKRDGLWKIYFKSGEKKSIGSFQNNQKQGEWISYHRNGSIKTKGIYKNNKRNGDWVELDKYGSESFRYLFKEDEDLRGSGKYINDYKVDRNNKKIITKQPVDFVRHLKLNKDKLVIYKNSGNLFTGTYIMRPIQAWASTFYFESVKNGKLDGLSYSYDKPNKIRGIKNFVRGKTGIEGVEARYWSNGNLKRKVFRNNSKFQGLSLYVYENGNIQEKFVYKDGKAEGDYRQFHENGKLLAKGFYKNGKLDGLFETFNKDGNLETSTKYKDGKKIK